jgi:putative ABC transport system permease protein
MNKEKEQPASQIPARWLRVLEWFCPAHLYEGIEGDLVEQYDADRYTVGDKIAKRRLILNVIRFFRPGILLRNRFSIRLIKGYMLLNYFKIMMRSMAKRKVYSAINIFGLTMGISFALLVGIFIAGELQTNQHLTAVDRLYLIRSNNLEAANQIPLFSPSPVARLIKENYPTLVENFYRCSDRNITVSKGDKHFRVQSLIGDSTFLPMFGFPLLHGDATTALNEPRSIVITEKIANQYFSRNDVVGETLTIATEKNGNQEYSITGVLQNLEANTVTDLLDMNAQIFLPIHSLKDFNNFDPEAWTGAQMISYICKTPGASEDEISKAFAVILKDKAPANTQSNLKISLDGLDDYHLVSNNGLVKKLVLTLTVIGIFILLLAIINFINITIGNSSVRLKEIGVRKAIGGVRKQVTTQFMAESLVMTFVATVLSLGLYELLRTYAGNVVATPLASVINFPASYWGFIGAVMLATGIVAGIYPAFFLASCKTLESLKGKLKVGKRNITLSRSLISIQFLLAIGVFTAAIIITRQVSYFLEKDLGYNKECVVTVSSVPRDWTADGFNRMDAAKHQFRRVPSVQSVSLSWDIPNGNFGIVAELYRHGTQPDEGIGMPILMADESYNDTYQLTMLAGTFFQEEGQVQQPDDMVINESAQKALRVQIGDKIEMKGIPTAFRVVGIVKDFNFFSLHQQVKPLVFMNTRNSLFPAFRYFSFKLQPGNIAQSVEALEQRWKEVFPNDPFEYAFMDQNLERLYKTEIQMKKAAGFATVLMLFIVLLGVLGLASQSVTRRTKEIGIRKVLGATVSNVLLLIVREFIGLIAIALLVAIPLTYYFVEQWLSTFAYHIDLHWWMFAVPGILVFLISLLVVSGQSLKAALSNPVDSLRIE